MRKLAHPLYLLLLGLVIACSSDSIEPSLNEDSNEQNDETDLDLENPNDDWVTFNFEGTGPLIDYVTNNETVLPEVSREEGRYRAELTDNENDKTLHFNDVQGRLDAKLVSFPFEVIARNIGIGTLNDSQTAPIPSNSLYIFCGIQIHVENLDSFNSAHVVVGHRGNTHFTIEGKNTVDGNSSVNDIGGNMVTNGRADIRIVGNENRTIDVYWQTPNLDFESTEDHWTAYTNSGDLPGTAPSFGNNVYVGLITYAFGSNGVPFAGTCDALQIKD